MLKIHISSSILGDSQGAPHPLVFPGANGLLLGGALCNWVNKNIVIVCAVSKSSTRGCLTEED